MSSDHGTPLPCPSGLPPTTASGKQPSAQQKRYGGVVEKMNTYKQLEESKLKLAQDWVNLQQVNLNCFYYCVAQ